MLEETILAQVKTSASTSNILHYNYTLLKPTSIEESINDDV